MKKLFIFGMILGLICMGWVANGAAQPIRVGSIINLTGPYSSWGQYHAKGEQDYFRYINEVNGGVVGRKIDLTVVDHAYKVPEAIKFVKKFCEEKMVYIRVGRGVRYPGKANSSRIQNTIPKLFYSSGNSCPSNRLRLSTLWELYFGLSCRDGVYPKHP
jgi:hypothetical protein